MAKRLTLVLPCLTAVGLLSAWAAAQAQELNFDVATPAENTGEPVPQPPEAPRQYRRPAVPPLPGPDSPLLQLGLVKPAQRPQSFSSGNQPPNDTGMAFQAQSLPPNPPGASGNLPVPVQTTQLDPPKPDAVAVQLPDDLSEQPTLPDLMVHPTLKVELGRASPEIQVTEVAPVLFAPNSDGVTLPTQIAAGAFVDLPKSDVAEIAIGEVLFAPRSYEATLPQQIAAARINLPASEPDIVTIGDTLYAPQSDGVNLKTRIMTIASIDLPKDDTPGIEIADNLFATQTASVDLAFHYGVTATLPPAPAEITIAEIPSKLADQHDAVDLNVGPVLRVELKAESQEPVTEALAAPKPRQREEKLAAAIRAQSQRAELPPAEGGPELSFKLRH